MRANKVRAHARLSEVVAGSVAPEEFLGNLVADAAAGLAAQESTYANGPNLRRARQWDELGVLIAKRLAVLEAERWDSGPRRVAPLSALRRVCPI